MAALFRPRPAVSASTASSTWRALTREPQRTKPKSSPGIPWRLWAALLIAGLVISLTYRLFPPPFEHTALQLTHHGNTLSVDFDAINHTRTPLTTTLRISVGSVHYGKFGPNYAPTDHQDVSVSLAPSETKHIQCDFPDTGRSLTNGAEVTSLQ